MFSEFLEKLMGFSDAPQMDPDEARLALLALLVRLARTDGLYTASEAGRIIRIAQSRYALAEDAARTLCARAETLESEAPDTHRFTEAIKASVPYEDRIGVVEALWQVALADGGRGAEEDALIRMVTRFLGVGDRDSALARRRVSQ